MIKHIKRLTLVVVGAMLVGSMLVGCYDQEVGRRDREYRIVDIDPPKRFRITIQDVETRQIYRNLYVSKRCNYWKKLRLNSIWTFTEVTYQGKQTTYTRVKGANQLCTALKRM